MANAFFSDLLATISERGRTLLRRAGPSDDGQDASDLVELCEALLSGRNIDMDRHRAIVCANGGRAT